MAEYSWLRLLNLIRSKAIVTSSIHGSLKWRNRNVNWIHRQAKEFSKRERECEIQSLSLKSLVSFFNFSHFWGHFHQIICIAQGIVHKSRPHFLQSFRQCAIYIWYYETDTKSIVQLKGFSN